MVTNLGKTLTKALTDNPQPGTTVTVADGVVTITINNALLAKPLQLVITSNDSLFLIGTKSLVDEVLAGKGGLVDSPAYKRAQATYLSDVTQELYVGPSAFGLAADLIGVGSATVGETFSRIVSALQPGIPTPTAAPRGYYTQEALRFSTVYRSILASVFDSLSITSNNGTDGAFIGRASITLK